MRKELDYQLYLAFLKSMGTRGFGFQTPNLYPIQLGKAMAESLNWGETG
jgi:hypothetical protein